ncbi:MAG: rhombosortase [Pseudomonadota bacterium]
MTIDPRVSPRIAAFRVADWLSLVVPGGIALGLAFGGNAARLLLRYQRDALNEPWRWISAHLVHMNLSHLVLDGTTLVLVWWLFVGSLPARLWWASFFGASLAIDLALWWWHPEIHWYVGLSGVLHGLFAAGVAWSLLARQPLARWLLLGLVLKLTWEVLVGPMPWSESASRGPVVQVAHTYGAIGGALAFGIVCTLNESCRNRLSVLRAAR